ncbi:tetratricopeptide repeat protein [Govanella unica]|uniref:Tetratricopeptide repeat protein n=1 Tax=Govanella unica TaxID=2975056 RepID=A0A9X3Z6N5_9PROT|nr:tetratricopeptide repeat protein [Govania unica]MDA5193203.1 tetratricopeptide repeat protein [Govania unica]
MTQASAELSPSLHSLPEATLRKLQTLLTKSKKHADSGDWASASKYLVEAWNLNPRDFDLLVAVAEGLGKLGVRRQALEVLEQALAIHGPKADVLAVLGNLASDLEMYDTMEKIYRIYIPLKPDDPTGYNNLASALEKQDKLDEAIDFLQEVIPLFPDIASLWNTIGTAVSLRDGYKASIPFYSEAYRLAPESYNVLNNISLAYEHSGNHKQAIQFAKKAIKVNFKNWNAHMGLSSSALATGDLRTGWREYEWRNKPGAANALYYTHEHADWKGESLAGKRLLICPEQGLGDEILFAASYPRLTAEAEQLYIGCDRRLVTLYQRSFPTAVIGAYGDGFHNSYRYRSMPTLQKDLPPADRAIACGSVPLHRWKSVASIPDNVDGFLIPDPERLAVWRTRLADLGPKPKIGIYWRSGKQNARRNKHYAPIEVWGPVFAAFPDVDFINLQYGDCADELALVRDQFGATIHQWDDANLRDDLETVAALSKAVDLVIGPASAPGMFSFAVGTPTWWLLPTRPWWSFGANEVTPFFSKGRMLIGSIDDPWDGLIPRLIQDLRGYLDQNRSGSL